MPGSDLGEHLENGIFPLCFTLSCGRTQVPWWLPMQWVKGATPGAGPRPAPQARPFGCIRPIINTSPPGHPSLPCAFPLPTQSSEQSSIFSTAAIAMDARPETPRSTEPDDLPTPEGSHRRRPAVHRRGLKRSSAACQRCRKRKQKVSRLAPLSCVQSVGPSADNLLIIV